MYRSLLGAIAGGSVAFFAGYVLGVLDNEFAHMALFIAAIMAVGGTTAGAIVGATGDLLADLRKTFLAPLPPPADADSG